MSRVVRAISIATLAACALGTGTGDPPRPRTHTVKIANMQFIPATLTIRPGDAIEWVNDDLVPHTATATDGVFDSKTIAAGGTWRWTAEAKGTVPYLCSLHPTMSARLQVQ